MAELTISEARTVGLNIPFPRYFLYQLDALILKYVVIDTHYYNVMLMVGSIISEL